MSKSSEKFEKSEKSKSSEKVKDRKPRNGACVSVSGLSKTVKKKQVVHELFKDCKITNYGLYIETQNGVCTGKCYVEFVDHETRSRALKSHNSKFHSKTVSVSDANLQIQIIPIFQEFDLK